MINQWKAIEAICDIKSPGCTAGTAAEAKLYTAGTYEEALEEARKDGWHLGHNQNDYCPQCWETYHQYQLLPAEDPGLAGGDVVVLPGPNGEPEVVPEADYS